MSRHGRQTHAKNRERARIKKRYTQTDSRLYRRTQFTATHVRSIQYDRAVAAAPYRRGTYEGLVP